MNYFRTKFSRILQKSALLLLLCTASAALAQTSPLTDRVKRLQAFGKSLPQEKVFLHLDNNSYFLGDTIWYKAYLTRTDNLRASSLSGVLYVELLNQDGYLVERQLIQMKNGQGHGAFSLTDTTLYGGYYEVRAYTRWMLNWGVKEHERARRSDEWFYNDNMAAAYYRDYDKIYSRVVPVYDRPLSPGDYTQDMTLRPMARYFKTKEEKEKAEIHLYPEGGNLLVGTPNRVAFEVNTTEGKHLEGKLLITDSEGREIAQAPIENRGRGSFTFTPKPGITYKAFYRQNAQNASANLPTPEKTGCGLQVEMTADSLLLHLHPVGLTEAENPGITVMQSGICQYFITRPDLYSRPQTISIPLDTLRTGINQITVFQSEGKIFADRLCFVNQGNTVHNALQFEGIKPSYGPFEPIQLKIKRDTPGMALVSLSVRDAATSDVSYDDGSLLTEMLLASELKGFVENPNYYFESNDDAHRRHLDLLLMVQGWRRFGWVTMTTPKAFSLIHPYERTQRLDGGVYNYTAQAEEELFGEAADNYNDPSETEFEQDKKKEKAEDDEQEQTHVDDLNARLRNELGGRTTDPAARFHQKETNIKDSVTVHSEFHAMRADLADEPMMIGDMNTKSGLFSINAPNYQGKYVLHLAATRPKNAQKEGFLWVQPNNPNAKGGDWYADYYVKLNPFYPNFAKPYAYYQQEQPPLPINTPEEQRITAEGKRLLNTVMVKRRRGGKRSYLYSKPAFNLDVYEAFNRICDLGLCTGRFPGANRFAEDVARAYIGDMGVEQGYNVEVRLDKKNASFNQSTYDKNQYNRLSNLSRVVVYTDYCPRQEGSNRYDGSNQPDVIVDIRRIPENGERFTYRDRFYIMPGFAICEEFYSPDYSTRPLPETKDYRRTLYWNPNLLLNENGEAEVVLYNNAKFTQIDVTAEGFGTRSEWLSGRHDAYGK